MRETIDSFIAVRLLTTNEVAGTTTIEVSHEALIREWPRLADWLHEARDDIRLQQTISKDAADGTVQQVWRSPLPWLPTQRGASMG